MELADIAPEFAFVMKQGLVPSTSDYSPQEFGNASLIMTGGPFSLRFERDRGQVFVDVSGKAGGWHKLEYVLEFVDPSISQAQLGEPPDVARLAELLEARWHKVIDLFSDSQRTEQFETFGKEKAAALLNQIFRKR